jgi:hypothetical protein|tara:strand:- start:7396 stop:10863 length:3468 start_codon:yes stop_codon:yes gene_type:complete
MALNSTSVISFIDLLCEGPIEGLVGDKEGIFLDETPVKSDAGVNNFSSKDVARSFRTGGRTQSRLPQAGAGPSTINDINTEIGENYSENLNDSNKVVGRDYGPGTLVRQVTDLETDNIEILFTIPRLFSVAQEGLAKGQVFNGTIRVKVFVQPKGKSFSKVYDRRITGSSTSNYQFKTPKIRLFGTGPWNVKVEKVNLGEDHFEIKFKNFQDVEKNISLASSRANQIFWTSLIESQSLRSAYPYCAVAGLSISTRQFQSLPNRAYKIRGRIVQIPANATARSDGSLRFKGNFNGTLRSSWTTCPVCCWYDMLTNKRYGAGDFVQASNVSWVDLYPLAVYSNDLIKTPDGGEEPRFACNTVIGDQAQAFNVLQDLASAFRGMLYWQANVIQASADHGNLDGSDVDPVHLYNNSNVIEGLFNYSGTSLKTRSSSIRVRYNDPDNFYKTNFIVVEDAELIDKYGYQIKEIVSFGATSKWQAQRLGRWMLASEEIDGEIVTFSTGLTGAVVLPGQVFAISDEVRSGVRIAGRVGASTTRFQVETDDAIVIPDGANSRITCVLPDGSIETKTIDQVVGKIITIQGSFSATPLLQSVFSVATDKVNLQKFRCLSVVDSGDGTYAVTGVEHNDSIYSVADTNQELEFQDITTFDQAPAAPINLKIIASQISINNNTVNRLVASWSPGSNTNNLEFEVRYKVSGGSFIKAKTEGATFTVDSVLPGALFVFQVRALGVSPIQKASAWVETSITVPSAGIDPNDPTKVGVPPDPANVTVQKTSGGEVILRWTIPFTGANPEDLIAIIRHSSLTDGTGVWSDSVKLTEVKAVTQYAVLPLLEGEYLIKFQQNITLSRSVNAGSAVIDLPDEIPRLNVQVRREDLDSPKFQGQLDQVFYQDTNGIDGLVLDGTGLFDNIPSIDDIGHSGAQNNISNTIDFIGDRFASGEYYFKDTLDLGGKFSVLFKRKIKAIGIYPDDLIDSRTELIDRWSDVDGLNADDTSSKIYFRSSDQTPADVVTLMEDGSKLLLEDGNDIEQESDVDFGDWTPMESGQFFGRVFQFKVELTTDHPDQTPVVQELGYNMQMESRTEFSDIISSGAAPKAVTFANAFYQEPSIGLTVSNLTSGDYYQITSTSRQGFTVTFYDSSDTVISRNFEYAASGYGVEL